MFLDAFQSDEQRLEAWWHSCQWLSCSCVVKSQYWASAAAREAGLYPATAVLGRRGSPHIAAEYGPINIAWHLLSSWETESRLFLKWCPIATHRQCRTEDAAHERLCLTWAAAPESASYRKKMEIWSSLNRWKQENFASITLTRLHFVNCCQFGLKGLGLSPHFKGWQHHRAPFLLDGFWKVFPSNQALLQTVASDLLPP